MDGTRRREKNSVAANEEPGGGGDGDGDRKRPKTENVKEAVPKLILSKYGGTFRSKLKFTDRRVVENRHNLPRPEDRDDVEVAKGDGDDDDDELRRTGGGGGGDGGGGGGEPTVRRFEELRDKYFDRSVRDTIAVVVNVVFVNLLTVMHCMSLMYVAHRRRRRVRWPLYVEYVRAMDRVLADNCADVISMFADSDYEHALLMFALSLYTGLKAFGCASLRTGTVVLKKLERLRWHEAAAAKSVTAFDHGRVMATLTSDAFRSSYGSLSAAIERGTGDDPYTVKCWQLFFTPAVARIACFLSATEAIANAADVDTVVQLIDEACDDARWYSHVHRNGPSRLDGYPIGKLIALVGNNNNNYCPPTDDGGSGDRNAAGRKRATTTATSTTSTTTAVTTSCAGTTERQKAAVTTLLPPRIFLHAPNSRLDWSALTTSADATCSPVFDAATSTLNRPVDVNASRVTYSHKKFDVTCRPARTRSEPMISSLAPMPASDEDSSDENPRVRGGPPTRHSYFHKRTRRFVPVRRANGAAEIQKPNVSYAGRCSATHWTVAPETDRIRIASTGVSSAAAYEHKKFNGRVGGRPLDMVKGD